MSELLSEPSQDGFATVPQSLDMPSLWGWWGIQEAELGRAPRL